MTDKLCKDCKWCVVKETPDEIERYYYATCSHPHIVHHDRIAEIAELVTGETADTVTRPYCIMERCETNWFATRWPYSECGARGALWESQNAFLNRRK